MGAHVLCAHCALLTALCHTYLVVWWLRTQPGDLHLGQREGGALSVSPFPAGTHASWCCCVRAHSLATLPVTMSAGARTLLRSLGAATQFICCCCSCWSDFTLFINCLFLLHLNCGWFPPQLEQIWGNLHSFFEQ